jgi:hypothetical protein
MPGRGRDPADLRLLGSSDNWWCGSFLRCGWRRQLFAGDAAAEAGVIGEGGGERRIGGCCVAPAGVLPVGQGHGRRRVRTEGRAIVAMGDGVLAPRVTKRGEGGGVVAALGQEVAAEAELVSPLPQPQRSERTLAAELPAGADMAAKVLGDVEAVDLGGAADAAVVRADRLGAGGCRPVSGGSRGGRAGVPTRTGRSGRTGTRPRG